jgi:hypothetical protein
VALNKARRILLNPLQFEAQELKLNKICEAQAPT